VGIFAAVAITSSLVCMSSHETRTMARRAIAAAGAAGTNLNKVPNLVKVLREDEIASFLAMTARWKIASCLAMTARLEIASFLAMTDDDALVEVIGILFI